MSRDLDVDGAGPEMEREPEPEPEPVPVAAAEAAEAAGLGSVVRAYRAAPAARVAVAAACLAVAAGLGLITYLGAVGLQDANPRELWFFVTLTLLCLAVGLAAAVAGLRVAQQRTYLHERGILHLARGRAEAFAWPEVAAVVRRVARRGPGDPYGLEYTCTLTHTDGRTLTLTEDIPSIAELTATIASRVAAQRLPVAMAALVAGDSLAFGRLRVSRAGLAAGEPFLPWSRIDEVDTRDGYLVVRTEGRWQRFAHLRVADTPNLALLVALANRLTRDQR